MSTNSEDDVTIKPDTFAVLSPSRFLAFTFPNPNPNPNLPLLRIAVLDSPIAESRPSTGAILVPAGREHDWIFCTFAGHLHLLLSSSVSRLILVGSEPKPGSDILTPYVHSGGSDPDPELKTRIRPLLRALTPKSEGNRMPEIPFLEYEDDVTRIVPVERRVGPTVGEFVVEDAEIDGEFRRRLRFKQVPTLLQSQVRISEPGSLLQPYLGPMVAGLSLLGSDSEPNYRALCIGVGGGDLLMCLRCQFGFNVVGVEVDEVVLDVAKLHFGLVEDELLRVVVGDGIKLLESRNGEFGDSSFDVVMVDLDSGDVSNGICAPPVEFVEKSVLLGARRAVGERGIVVLNVIPLDEGFYRRLIGYVREVFDEVYEIDVGNGENYVVVGVVLSNRLVRKEKKGWVYEKLREVGIQKFVDGIKRI